MWDKFLVRYGEIALKGKNRHQFEQKLQHNLQAAVKNYRGAVKRMQGRLMISGPEENRDMIIARVKNTFGVVSLSPVKETELDLERIKEIACEMTGKRSPEESKFKVNARRPNKNFPYTSPEINRLLGAHLQANFPGLEVDLTNPDFALAIEISKEKAYLFSETISGPGGLPVGITGGSLLLLSGGIDSPVAGWLAMKRGVALEALHFHSFPFTSRHSQEKAVALCRKLAVYCGKISLHMISVANIQKELRSFCPDELGIILLRRMMMRLAERLSEKRELQALVTGESLGQVASQTLESIAVIEKSTDMLTLRPLLGMDKKDIVDLGINLDTYDISVRPYEDCCTVFSPRNPVTKPKLEAVENHEAKLDIEGLLKESLETLETTTIER
ncbi:MAG: tRNA uracil 4-sulfurtransferase ThiI [Bacillota bacterium]